MINLRNVNFDYPLEGGTFRALQDVNLRVERGEFVAIIGSSGSGKTTLMNIMGLLATPTSGEVEIGGLQVSALDADGLAATRNQKLAFIFQHFNLLPRLTVLENVLLPAQYIEDGRPTSPKHWEQRALTLLKTFGLEGQEEKTPALLSGGQKQRVAICRALLLNPDVLLADEPTGALDSVNTALVLDLLQQMNREGRTILVITHDHQVASRATRVVRIHDGRIVSDTTNPHPRTDTAEQRSEQTKNQSKQQAATEEKGLLQSAKDVSLLPNNPYGPVSHLFRFTAVRQAFANLGVNPVRSMLTVFGLSIGMSAIIIMLTLTSEARAAFQRFFDTNGGKSAFISSDSREAERLGTGRWQGLNRDVDVPALNRYFSRYGRIDPATEVNGCQFRSRFRTSSGSAKGTDTLSQFRESEMVLQSGRFFSPSEVFEPPVAKVAILGQSAASKLFPALSEEAIANPNYPVGETVSIRGGCPLDLTLTVVGVLEEQDTAFDDSLNESIWVPSRTLRAGGLSAYTRALVAIPHDNVSPTWFAENIKSYLRASTGDRHPFRAFVPEQQIARVNQMLSVLGALTIVVGSICTIIGGIGVMNIMLVNIAERIREIGIRKALGAKGFRIRNQFLMESTVLCLVAGFLGVAVGVLVSNLAMAAAAYGFPRYVEAGVYWNQTAVVLALVSSVAAGFGFGLLPARRASAMDVVEALRQE